MDLQHLHSGDTVTIKLAHWSREQKAIVLSRRAAHCQLHGEYMHDEIVFRAVKASGKLGGLFSLPVHTEPEVLQVLG